jgi:hypothetical protein
MSMPLSQDQICIVIRACEFGGGFVQRLGDALAVADPANRAALLQAFGPHGTGTLCAYLPGGWRYEDEMRRFVANA